MRIDENFHLIYGLVGANVGVIKSEGEIALVDAGQTDESVDLILSYVNLIKSSEALKYVLLTHADGDHVGGLRRLKEEYKIRIVAHETEAERIEKPQPPMLPVTADIAFREEKMMKVGGLELRLIPTPGHTPGSTCIYCEKHRILFSGDVVMPDYYFQPLRRLICMPIIRGSIETYIASLKRLQRLDVEWLLPGHGKPIKDGGERINDYIQKAQRLKEMAYEFLREELSPSELSEKLNAFSGVGQILINELEGEGKVERVGEKVLLKEPSYRRR